MLNVFKKKTLIKFKTYNGKIFNNYCVSTISATTQPPTIPITPVITKPMNGQYSNCGFCGFNNSMLSFPHTCKMCNNTTFRNPIPVAVGILSFVDEKDRRGVLLVRRSIQPFIGGLCFPGGFVNWGESWREAISREVFEETGVVSDPDEYVLKNVHSTPDNARILIFGYSKKVRQMEEIKGFVPSNETSELVIERAGGQLCFSLHQSVFDDWFYGQSRE